MPCTDETVWFDEIVWTATANGGTRLRMICVVRQSSVVLIDAGWARLCHVPGFCPVCSLTGMRRCQSTA